MLARYMLSICSSGCLSQLDVLSTWMDGSSWFLACRPRLCYKEIQISTKIWVLPFGTLSVTPDLENMSIDGFDGIQVTEFVSKR